MNSTSIPEIERSIASTLEQMLHDERPELDRETSTDNAHLIDQLELMYAEQALTNRPGSYYTTQGTDPHDFPISNKSKPHTVRHRYHPISQRLSDEMDKIRTIAAPNVYICGADPVRRYNKTNWRDRPVKAAAYVVPAYGDVFCAYEMMALIEQRMQESAILGQPPIIIDNSGDFWKYLLWEFSPEQLAGLNIFALREYEWNKAEAILHEINDAFAKPIMQQAILPEDSLILVGTKTNEKIIELQELFKGTGVRVMRLDHFANFQDPPETSGTYAGNAMEKIRNSHEALRQRARHAPELLKQNILNNCPDPKHPHVFLLSEDSGMHLEDRRVSQLMQQEGLLKGKVKNALMLHHDQFPGEEFGPAVNGALGEEGFWETVNDVIERHKYDKNPDTCTGNRGVVNASVLALSPFNIDQPNEKQPVYMFSGTNMSMLLDTPIVAEGEIPNTAHYLVPVTQGLKPLGEHGLASQQLTQAQLGPDYLGQHSARTFAVRALRHQMGLPKGMNHELRSPKLHVGLSNPSQMGKLPMQHVSQTSPLQPIQFAGNDWSQQAEAMCADPDAYYLTPRDDPKGSGNTLFEDIFRFCSLIVSKQLVPRDKDKPIIVQKDDASWQPFLGLYDHLRHIGMANDQQNTFIRRIRDNAHLQALLEQTSQNKFSGEYDTPCTFTDKAMSELKKQSPEHFNVAMFCSAGSKNQTFNDEAFNLGKHLAQQGHGMVFGAADKEMMGSARKGYLKGRTKDSKALLIGSSTQDILPIESEHPQAVIDSLDVYHHAEHIYDRMQFMMQNSDAFMIYSGGVGTVQELMLLLCAKQAQNPDIGDKPIVLYNKPLRIGKEQIGFYDPLIEMVGKHTLEKYGVTICTSEQEVFAAISKAQKRGKEAASSVHASSVSSDGNGVRENGSGITV